MPRRCTGSRRSGVSTRRCSSTRSSRRTGGRCRGASAQSPTSSSGRLTRSTSSSSRSSSSESGRTGTSTRGPTRACTAWDTRRSSPKTSSSTGSAPSTEPSRSTSKSRTGSFGSRTFSSSCSICTTSVRTSFCRRFRYNEARSLIEAGLEDFSISRQGQPWGVPIPWDPEQVTWVWVDALINYLSALTYARPGEDLRERYWPDVRHLIGKDILRLHCVLWPALLLAAGYTLPKQLFVHGFLLLDDRKISKTLGNVIDPLDLTGVYGIDPVRFWAARAVQFGQDGIGLARLAARALREGARERSRQPPVAHDRDAGQVPRRAHSRGGEPARDGDRRRAPHERGGATRRVRHHRRARRDLGSRSATEQARHRHEAVGAREGRRERRAARPRALHARGRSPRDRGRACGVSPGDVAADPRGARSGRRSRLGERRRREDRPDRRHRGGSSRSSRASKLPQQPRDRHSCAPRRVRGPAGRARSPSARGGRGEDPHGRHDDRALADRARARRPTCGGVRDSRDPPARGVGETTTSTRCAICSRTRARSRSARPASTSFATTPRTTARARSSGSSSGWPPSSGSRS